MNKTMGLLEKAFERREQLRSSDVEDNSFLKENKDQRGLLQKAKEIRKQEFLDLGIEKSGREIIEEKSGFGYKGMGKLRIVLDHSSNEYIYEVDEPRLNKNEEELKMHLSRLFKMLSDKNVTGMEKNEKKKYLRETLEQIIADNNIKFIFNEDEKKTGFDFKNLFKKTNKETKTEKKSSKTISELFKGLFDKKDEGKKTISDHVNLVLPEEERRVRDKIFYHLFREFIGYDRIDILMEDEDIEDISCDGHHVPVFIYHKKYEELVTNIQFESADELDSFVVRLAQICGKQISVYSPIVDGKLPDGSRLQTTLGKTVTKPSTFTIRKFKENPLTPIDLLNFRSLSLDMAAYFWMAIENSKSILFCGGTASGKTTALNALSLFIPALHKIVSIEDTREVNLPHKNWVSGTTREGFSSSENKTGKDIDMFDLIRAALRQRPKVIIVGEVRGKEAYNLFQAMSTGHTAYSTVHASNIHTLIQRLENPPISLPRALLTSLDIIVFQNAIDLGDKTVRRMTSVTEVVKIDPDTQQLIFIEPFRWVSKVDDRFEKKEGSKVLNEIMIEKGWTDKQLKKELENRKIILRWMQKKNLRNYRQVGRIVTIYSKYPEKLLEKAKEDLGI